MNQLFKPGAMMLLLATQALLACGQNGERPAQSVDIQIAKPSKLAMKIRECSMSKLSPKVLVYRAKTDAIACRLDAEGSAKDTGFRPSFQIRTEAAGDVDKTKSRRVQLRQKIGFFSPEDESLKATPEIMKRNVRASEILNQSCAPIVKRILGRSGLAASIVFRALQEGDQIENGSSATGGDGSDGLDDLFSAPESRDAKDLAAKKKESSAYTESMKAIHVMLPLRFDSEKGISIHDELQPVWSGSSTDSQTVEPFCAQLAVRVLEGFGVVSGRDCACRLGQEACKELGGNTASDVASENANGAKDTAKAAGKKKSARPDVTKMTDPAEIVKSGRLSGSEIKQVLEPICGSFDGDEKK